MQEAKINLRLKNILLRLCRESEYVTITSIARDLGLSSRTILRELPTVERWLLKHGCKLETKAGVGVRINGTAEDRQKISQQLQEQQEEKIYTPRERQLIIAAELLQNKEPIKLYSFTCILDVAEGTISNDLDKLEGWFTGHGLTLVRRQGVGVYIEGDEDKIRKCMISLIHENLNENYLLGLIRGNVAKEAPPASDNELAARGRLLNLVNDSTIRQLENLVHNAEEQIGNRLADSAYAGLIVHLAIAIQRIRKNEDISMDRRFMEELKESREYAVAERLAKKIGELFGLEIPEDEIGYITMHIKGSKYFDAEDHERQGGKACFELEELAREIVRVAETETGRFLTQNEKLMTGLVNHLGPAVSRLRMNLEIRNPLLAQIKAYYPELMKVAGECAKVLEKYTGMKIPEAEVAYIAMHLGAAVEKSELVQKRKYRAVIVCATGIGTSRLLATRLEKEFENIQIADVASALRIDREWLSSKGAEFVISTIPLEGCPVPVAVVNPLLLEKDKEKITELVGKLKKASPVMYPSKVKIQGIKEKIQAMTQYGRAITEILDNFFIIEDSDAEDVGGLIREVCRQTGLEGEASEMLYSDLMAREEKGGTFIAEYGILLLHCRTKTIDKMYFGMLKARKDIFYNGADGEKGQVRLGVAIVAPEEADKYLLEAISHVNGMLIENPGFTELMISGKKEEIVEELGNILEEFYNMMSSKYLTE